jgi:hypothetical protein
MTLEDLWLDKFQNHQRDGRAFGFIGLKGDDDDYQGWFFVWPREEPEIRSVAERDAVLDSLDADQTRPNDPQIPYKLARRRLERFLRAAFDLRRKAA